MIIRIAARQSDLARLQAFRVGDALRTAAQRDGKNLEIKYQFRASLGDLNQQDPLWRMPEKGVFTEDFLTDLKEGSADLVVHSWKDLPTEPRPETAIVATLPRADVRDLLLFRRDKLKELEGAIKRSIRILSSSPRRAYNLAGFLKAYLPQPLCRHRAIEFESVRGNIPTRLKKLLSQDVDGLVVAKAALDRLILARESEFKSAQATIAEALSQTRFMVLPLRVNPTAAAQGALAIEIAKNREDGGLLESLLAQVNCPETFLNVQTERKILASHGGGCHQKIGVSVLSRPFGQLQYLKGLTDAGLVLEETRLTAVAARVERAKSVADIFPGPGDKVSFFERAPLPEQDRKAAHAVILRAEALWIARDTAWPTSNHIDNPTDVGETSESAFPLTLKDSQVVWSAGLATWRKLALLGVWVSGSAEGLGENENPDIDALCGHALDWLKLTHSDAARTSSSELQTLATYKLVPTSQPPSLKNKTHCYWMSGSSFARALALEPSLRSAHHACGPGHTYQYLRSVLGDGAKILVYLDLQAWRSDVLPDEFNQTNSR